jgi:excisionase family DNA binding protein
MAGEDWITLEEAAQRLHVVLETMRRWVRQGQFPRTKVGKRYLVPRQAIEDFLERNMEHPRPVTPREEKKPEETRPSRLTSAGSQRLATPEAARPSKKKSG